MKRVIAACTIFALMLLVGTAISSAICRTADTLSAQTDEVFALLTADDSAGAAAYLQKSYDDWQAWCKLLRIIIHHRDLDEIEKLYLRTLQNATDGQLADARMQARELSALLRGLSEQERVSLGTIL